jgi:hypothetical protein
VLPSGQKLTLSLLATITLRVTHFRTYAQFLLLLPFFKSILEVMFCQDQFNCVKMAAFQFYLQSGKRRMTVMLFSVKNSLVRNEV